MIRQTIFSICLLIAQQQIENPYKSQININTKNLQVSHPQGFSLHQGNNQNEVTVIKQSYNNDQKVNQPQLIQKSDKIKFLPFPQIQLQKPKVTQENTIYSQLVDQLAKLQQTDWLHSHDTSIQSYSHVEDKVIKALQSCQCPPDDIFCVCPEILPTIVLPITQPVISDYHFVDNVDMNELNQLNNDKEQISQNIQLRFMQKVQQNNEKKINKIKIIYLLVLSNKQLLQKILKHTQESQQQSDQQQLDDQIQDQQQYTKQAEQNLNEQQDDFNKKETNLNSILLDQVKQQINFNQIIDLDKLSATEEQLQINEQSLTNQLRNQVEVMKKLVNNQNQNNQKKTKTIRLEEQDQQLRQKNKQMQKRHIVNNTQQLRLKKTTDY